MYEKILFENFPGFLSLRNSQHEIIYLNQNFRDWIAKYTDVDPLGKTNTQLAKIFPQNVADTFLQCHDGSLDLQKKDGLHEGLKKVIEFKGDYQKNEESQYFDVLKYKVLIDKQVYIFTVAYDITELYIENLRNLHFSLTDTLTKANNRRYLEKNIKLFYGHYGAVFDLDHFKMVNDLKGHIIGDHVLNEFVCFLNSELPLLIALIRLGGDEFLGIFQNGLSQSELAEQLEQVRKKYHEKYVHLNYLSFSYGIGMVTHDIDETLMKLDQKMYLDKKKNR